MWNIGSSSKLYSALCFVSLFFRMQSNTTKTNRGKERKGENIRQNRDSRPLGCPPAEDVRLWGYFKQDIGPRSECKESPGIKRQGERTKTAGEENNISDESLKVAFSSSVCHCRPTDQNHFHPFWHSELNSLFLLLWKLPSTKKLKR